jgi:folate-dependent phosphoribosylglycinamide formyltransferase PurN
MLAGEDIALGAAVRTHAKQRVIVIHPASMPEASGDTKHLQVFSY